MRVLIVDDEKPARDYLRELLAAESDVEIVAECEDGADVVAAAAHHRPDVAFLDVEMSQCDGIETARRLLAVDPRVRVVFVTAYDQFAVRAFEVQAVDYLLKPFDRERLGQTLDRLRILVARGGSGSGSGADDGDAAEDAIQTGPTGRGMLVSHVRGEIRLIPMEEIRWCRSEGNYVQVHHADGSDLVRITLARLEGQLPADRFVRVHRSTLVRIDQIRALEPAGHGDYRVHLHGGATLNMSRRYRPEIERILGDSL